MRKEFDGLENFEDYFTETEKFSRSDDETRDGE